MMPSKYLSEVLFEVSISGTLEVSIGGAFEYLLARYPLYRNVSDKGKLMIMHNDDTYGYLLAVLSSTGL